MGWRAFYLLLLCLICGYAPLAQAGGSINSGETKSGNIAGPSYQDTWTFDGTAGERVVFSFAHTSPPQSDLTWKEIFLYPPDGGQYEAYVMQYPNAILDHQLAQSGQYTVVVQDWRQDDTFTYNVSLVKNSASGPTIVSGQTQSGSIAIASLKAYYVSGKTGERIMMSFAHTSPLQSDLSWKDVRLYPPDGGPAEASVEQYPCAYLDHQLQQDGLYTIVVYDWNMDDHFDYNVSFVKNTGPNPSIVAGETQIGAIVPGSLKAYSFYGEAGEGAMISFAHTSAPQSSVTWKEILLYPPSGGPAEAFANQYPCALLNKQLAETGLYTIVVYDWQMDDSFDYSVCLVKNRGPFSSQSDPNGRLLESGGFASGTMALGDLDTYYFFGNAGDRAIISFTNTSPHQSGTTWKDIWLLPPSGGPPEAHAHNYPNVQMDYQLLETGLYAFVVNDWNMDDTFTYNVSLTKIPATQRTGLRNPWPMDGAAIANLKGQLSWDTTAGATGYDVYFGWERDKPLTQIGTNLLTPSLALPAMERKRVHYWRVVAHTEAGDVPGPYWWFFTAPQQADITPSIMLLLNDHPSNN
jgi:hypothetical protein